MTPATSESGETPTAAPASARNDAPRSRGGGSVLAVLLALLALGGAGYSVWRTQSAEQERAQAQSTADAALTARIDELTRSAEQRKRDLDGLRARLADTDGVNKSVREELLALEERSRHLEDAVANLAEQRLSGRDAIAMNEAEFLLQIAQERLALFHDAQAAMTAYKLADSSLAAAKDPTFASVRQTIAAELQALAASKPVDTQAALVSLERLRAGLATLPPPRAAAVADTPETGSWFSRFVSQFVHVSHGGEARPFETQDIGLKRSLVAIDLRSAEAALLARDGDAYRAALERARGGIAGAFDAQSAPVKAALAELERLAAAPLAPSIPELGTALKELRNLRTTRALSTPPAAESAPAAPEAATEAPPSPNGTIQ